ncbi:30S ribosomal protein S7 [candidate division KSB1 bacterium]|nr:30S ribosomal protein S7 [candidate division KSB1 bacterium]
MSRRRRTAKRQVLPDPVYNNIVVTKFINGLMEQGKRSVAETIFYTAMDIIEKKTDKTGLEVFEKGMDNVKPVLEVRSRRVGGATYQVPVEIRTNRRQALAIRWLISYSTARSENTMAQRLAAELIAAYNNEGTTIKKKDDTHKMAEANKAFAHFRW